MFDRVHRRRHPNIMPLSRRKKIGSLLRKVALFIVISAACHSFPRTAEAAQGNWAFSGFRWLSSENTVVPSSGTAITDFTVRMSVLSSNIGTQPTVAADESIMLPLCVASSVGGNEISKDTSYDSKMSFEATSTISVFILNGTRGSPSYIVPTAQTSSLAGKVTILYGHLKVFFPIDVYATGLTIVIALTKFKFTSGLTCGSSSFSMYGSRAGSLEPSRIYMFSSALIGMGGAGFHVLTAHLSDSRPSRPTIIRITAPNSRSSANFPCSNDGSQEIVLQLPLYFGAQSVMDTVNASALTVSMFGSADGSSSSYLKAFEATFTKLAFDPQPFELSGRLTPKAAFLPCIIGQSVGSGDFYIDIEGLTTPNIPSSQSLQLGIRYPGIGYGPATQVVYPDIETVSNARIYFGFNSASAGAQFVVSFLTSLDVNGICGPGDISNSKQRIVLRLHDATPMTQMCSSAAQVTARFLSVPSKVPIRIGRVVLSLNGTFCSISMYLSSGDPDVSGCTSRTLAAPKLPSDPIVLVIDGLNVPASPLPPLPVSIDIDEGIAKGVTQTCSKCAEWPSTPVFSGSIELSDESFYGFSSLLASVHGIGDISPGDTLTIQIPRGISYYYSGSSSSSPVICTGGLQRDLTTDNPKFDVQSYYPNLVLKWKSSNSVISSASIYVKCTWVSSNSNLNYWLSNFDSPSVNDLMIKKETGSGSVWRIISGSSPGRYFYPSLSVLFSDARPGLQTVFSVRFSRGSFSSKLLIPAVGFNMLTPSNGQSATAQCSCVPTTSAYSNSQYSARLLLPCTNGARADADVAMAGNFLKITVSSNSRFNHCNLTVQSTNAAAAAAGSGFAYIDDLPDRLYSAPSISSISQANVMLSSYALNAVIQATISFAHTTLLSVNSEIRLSGFCNFANTGSLTVSFSSGTASASLSGCNLVISIISGSVPPPPNGITVSFTVGNLRTPAVRQARSATSITTHSGSLSSAAVVDSCTDCAFVSEMPAFESSVSFSSSTPGAASVDIEIKMKNVWDPLIPGSIIYLSYPASSGASSAFPGEWTGPTSNHKILVNGAACDASVQLSNSGFSITHKGSATYTSLDVSLKLGPHYTVPRKLLKAFSIQVTKISNAKSVSAPMEYPEVSGSCPAGHSLNSTTKFCQRCNSFRYNDGTMPECSFCSGQAIGNSRLKATKCVAYCSWPFEYMPDGHYDGSCNRDGGLCSQFYNTEYEKECSCGPAQYPGNSYNPSAYYDNCKFVNLSANIPAVATIFSILVITFIVCVLRASCKESSNAVRMKARYFALALFPCLDFLSDLVYIMTSKYNGWQLFVASVFFFLLPSFMFLRRLMKYRAYVHFYLVPVPKQILPSEYDNILKLLYGFFITLPFYILNAPTVIPLFLAGHFLYCTKVMPISSVSNTWLRLYTGRRDHDSQSSIIVNLLQESIFEEIVTESIPQLVIQAVNQTLNDEWTPLGIISITLIHLLCRSSLMALNGIYRFLYYYLMKKIPVQDVPSGLEDDVFDLPGVEMGKYALQLPPPATTDSNHDAPPLNHRSTSQADASRQTFEMQSFEKQPLMQEMSSRLEGVELQLNDSSIRFASRLNDIETKVEGILQALKIGLSNENAAGQSIETRSNFRPAPSITTSIHELPVCVEGPKVQEALHLNPLNLVVSGGQSIETPSSFRPVLYLTPATHTIPVYGQAPRMQPALHHNPPDLVVAAGLTYDSKISSTPSLFLTPAAHEVPVCVEGPKVQEALHHNPLNLVVSGGQSIETPSSFRPDPSLTTATHEIHADGAAPKARQKSDLPNILLDSIEFAVSLSS